MTTQNKHKKESPDPYCDTCGGCGFIGCDGIRGFLKHHVEGKTNCRNEDVFLSEIILMCEDDE